MIIDEFSKYQIEWLTSHCDIEFNKEEEDLIIRFLNDTAEMYQRENECEDCGNKKCKELGKLPKGYDCALWQAESEEEDGTRQEMPV